MKLLYTAKFIFVSVIITSIIKIFCKLIKLNENFDLGE